MQVWEKVSMKLNIVENVMLGAISQLCVNTFGYTGCQGLSGAEVCFCKTDGFETHIKMKTFLFVIS